MDKRVFVSDPLIGCPFDDSEMRMVQNYKEFSVGNTVEFQGPNELGTTHRPWIRGKIIAIGKNAKLWNGDPFVAFAVQVGENVYIKTHRDIRRIT